MSSYRNEYVRLASDYKMFRSDMDRLHHCPNIIISLGILQILFQIKTYEYDKKESHYGDKKTLW